MRDRHFKLDHRRAPGLVGLWGSGPPGGPFLYDESGRGNDGTLSGGVTPVLDPERGFVLDYDNVDGLVTLPADVALGTTHSVTFWAKVDTDSGVAIGGQLAAEYAAFFLADRLYYSATQSIWFAGIGVVGTGWRHLAIARTGTAVALYIDGVHHQDKVLSGSSNLGIGRFGSYFDDSLAYDGRLDDIRLYTRLLAAAEFQHIYQKTKPNPYSDIAMKPSRVYKAAVAVDHVVNIDMTVPQYDAWAA